MSFSIIQKTCVPSFMLISWVIRRDRVKKKLFFTFILVTWILPLPNSLFTRESKFHYFYRSIHILYYVYTTAILSQRRSRCKLNQMEPFGADKSIEVICLMRTSLGEPLALFFTSFVLGVLSPSMKRREIFSSQPIVFICIIRSLVG